MDTASFDYSSAITAQRNAVGIFVAAMSICIGLRNAAAMTE